MRRADHVLFREVRGEAVLLDPRHGTYFALNHVGSAVWKGLADAVTREELSARVMETFEVPPDVAHRDLEAFVAELLERGLVVES